MWFVEQAEDRHRAPHVSKEIAMPATIDHMTTNFDRIEAGVLDHKRPNPDEAAAKTLRGLLNEARKTVKAQVREAAKAEKTNVPKVADLTDEVIAQRIWDTTIALAVEAGVQTSIPGTRGNVFRKEARLAAKAEQFVEESIVDSDTDEEPSDLLSDTLVGPAE